MTTGPGNRMTLLYSGEINALVALLARSKIDNLTIEEPSLEEIFMHYYK
jgi:ABC-2 type transport system ATP-binding protein